MDELTKTGIQRALELPDAPVADDLAVNEAGSWVHDKLTVVRKYDPAFGTACQSWGEWFYVDGLAGSGVNRIGEEGGRLIWGSPVISLRAQPPVANCLFLEQDAARAAALDHRTAALSTAGGTHLLQRVGRRYVPHVLSRRGCGCCSDEGCRRTEETRIRLPMLEVCNGSPRRRPKTPIVTATGTMPSNPNGKRRRRSRGAVVLGHADTRILARYQTRAAPTRTRRDRAHPGSRARARRVPPATPRRLPAESAGTCRPALAGATGCWTGACLSRMARRFGKPSSG